MTRHDFITAADLAEEQCAIEALRLATSTQQLGIIWSRDCDHFKDGSRERLQDEFNRQMRRLGALHG
jgi:hypothetical protein